MRSTSDPIERRGFEKIRATELVDINVLDNFTILETILRFTNNMFATMQELQEALRARKTRSNYNIVSLRVRP